MLPPLRICFTDFWTGFDPRQSLVYRLLSRHFDVRLTQEADYVFYSCMGYDYLRHPHSVRIFYTGENLVPDFNQCDYALGFHHLTLDDRYLRFPLYLTHKGCWDELDRLEAPKHPDPALARRRFCNFVYSRSRVQTDPLREYFFHRLSAYRPVDSGGRLLNNVGGPVADKLEFASHYKFTIAFENSAVAGYTTEKLIDPMRVLSLPVYYGNPRVDLDFNPASFVWVRSREDVDRAIQEIIRLDQDDDAYLRRLAQPWFTQRGVRQAYEERLEQFLLHIVGQPLAQARRTTDYGYVGTYRRDFARAMPLNGSYLFGKLCGLRDRLQGRHPAGPATEADAPTAMPDTPKAMPDAPTP